jgi:acyl-CoA reductase-like NAD-dependent aldehyde dehydrogenase
VWSPTPPGEAGPIGQELVEHPAVRRLNFTGSTTTGRKLAEAAGRHLKRVLLELGGHNPLLVLDDADLDYAVDASAFGAYLHQGVAGCSLESPQTCANVRAREWGRRGEVGEELVPPSG